MRKVFICFSECFSAQKWLDTKTGHGRRGEGCWRGSVKLLQLLMGLLVAAPAASLCWCASVWSVQRAMWSSDYATTSLYSHNAYAPSIQFRTQCSSTGLTGLCGPLGVCVMRTNTFQFSLTAGPNCLCHLQQQLTLTTAERMVKSFERLKDTWYFKGYQGLLLVIRLILHKSWTR